MSDRDPLAHRTSAYCAGETAWHEGQEKSTNPYSAQDEPQKRREWNDGYDYGQQDQPREE